MVKNGNTLIQIIEEVIFNLLFQGHRQVQVIDGNEKRIRIKSIDPNGLIVITEIMINPPANWLKEYFIKLKSISDALVDLNEETVKPSEDGEETSWGSLKMPHH